MILAYVLFALTLLIYVLYMVIRPSHRGSIAILTLSILLNVAVQVWLLTQGSLICTYIFLAIEALEGCAVGLLNEMVKKNLAMAVASQPCGNGNCDCGCGGYDDDDEDEDEDYDDDNYGEGSEDDDDEF